MSRLGLIVALLALAFLTISAIRRRLMIHKALSPTLPKFGEKAFQALEHEVLGAPPTPMSTLTHTAPTSESSHDKEILLEPALHDRVRPEGQPSSLSSLALLDGVVPAAANCLTWASVDPHLFHAIEQMTHQACESIGDLGQIISDRGWEAGSLFGANQYLVNNIKGHFAEWLAADHLQQAGHVVSMPLSSNQAGYDLIVDGHPFNVKSFKEVQSALCAHFRQHADIGVIVPGDALGIPHDAIHFDPTTGIDLAAAKEAGASVFVDDALSHVDVTDMTQSGLDAGAGHVNVHIPWITLAVSTIRESRLLLKGHTDIPRAAENIFTDGLFAFAGTNMGTKTGAAIGTMIYPGIGTIIGALAGGCVGLIAGRKAAYATKRRHLNKAINEFETSLSNFERAKTQTSHEVGQAWTAYKETQHQELKEKARSISHKTSKALASIQKSLEAVQRIPTGLAMDLLDEANHDLEEALNRAKAAYSRLPLIERWLWPSAKSAGAIKYLDTLRSYIKDWQRNAAALRSGIEGEAEVDAHRVFAKTMATETGEKKARAYLFQLGIHRASAIQQAEKIAVNGVSLIHLARAEKVLALRNKQKSLVASAEEKIRGPLEALKAARKSLILELRKAGAEVPD